jgi:hypothetical protein
MSKLDKVLYELIASMSSSEKRNFRLHSSRYQSDHNKSFMRLYDVYEKMEQWDAEALRAEIKKQVLDKGLAVFRQYLYRQLMDNLISQEKANAYGSWLWHKLDEISLLHKKGLHAHALSLIADLKAECVDMNEHTLMLEILSLEQDIYISKLDYQERISGLYAERKKVLDILNETHEWSTFSADLAPKLNTAKGLSKEAIKALIQSEQFTDESKSKFFQSKQVKYYLLGHLHFLLSENKEAAKYNQRAIDLYDEHPAFRASDLPAYLNLITNHAYILLGLGEWEKVESIMKLLQALPPEYCSEENSYLPKLAYNKFLNIQLRYLMLRKFYGQLAGLSKTYLSYYKEDEDLKEFRRKYWMLFVLTQAAYLSNNMSLVQRCLRLLLAEQVGINESMILGAAWILNLLCHCTDDSSEKVIQKVYKDGMHSMQLNAVQEPYLGLFCLMMERHGCKSRKEMLAIEKQMKSLIHLNDPVFSPLIFLDHWLKSI